MILIYDGECPFCTRYVRLARIRKAAGELRLVNARDGGPEVEAAKLKGYVIDEGMVLIMNDSFYHGDDCLNMLALLSTRQGLFNRINYWLFRYRWLSKVSYPVLRAGRNTVLWLMGRKKMGY